MSVYKHCDLFSHHDANTVAFVAFQSVSTDLYHGVNLKWSFKEGVCGFYWLPPPVGNEETRAFIWAVSHLATFYTLSFFLVCKFCCFFLQRPSTKKSYLGQVWPMFSSTCSLSTHIAHIKRSKVWRAGQVYSSHVVKVACCGLGGR